MAKKNCVICGKEGYSYFPFCYEHLQEKNEGKIVKCEDCGTWHYADKLCEKCGNHHTSNSSNDIEKVNENEAKCIICGSPSHGSKQCKDCFNETLNFIDSIDKNSNVRALRDYYYNLKEHILIINGIEAAKRQCNKLVAIALVARKINDDNSLLDRVYNDVQSLMAKKKPAIENIKIAEDRNEKDERKSKINVAIDGHNVESDMEVRIDDTLYKAFILHSYNKSIDEIIEKRKKCDWFIPISNGKGIYIEYWGMDTPEYLRERKEKEELYKKYNIPYISIEKDDPKKDTQTFEANLLRELRTLAIERYSFMPEWKK